MFVCFLFDNAKHNDDHVKIRLLYNQRITVHTISTHI